ncbi:PTS system fructose subfamily IIA component [Coriobacterium glomerans PW2]|uniref:PTS system fructose subfamily IIA component n=1 Tax=Coriobacterium glomerans (strain ATCC 49209 / DSM 20642 / JCM 10262 / PW2) TaxID=700015 RepID=F2N6X9_CORGP|nr:PTS fructose transporter subunit IIA [Coriobacterium glomerans]AEB06178.1 PTS system fructose subfamily IIA component [Coriobacterium glomerans PW2]
MRYLLLVSHGTLAPGLHSVLSMLVGDRSTISSCSLEDGMGADEYRDRVRRLIEPMGADDEVVVMGDIIGGSPLTNAMDLIAEKGLLGATMAFGGMNLPMAMTAAMGLDSMDADELRDSVLAEGRAGLRELDLRPALDENEDEEEI